MILLVVLTLAAALLWALPRDGRRRLARLLPARGQGRPGRSPALPALTGRVRRAAPPLSLRAVLAGRAEGEARRRAVVLLCRVTAAELRAGQPPESALRVAVLEAGPLVGEEASHVDRHCLRA